MLDPSIFCDEIPDDNQTRLVKWWGRLASYKLNLLMERVEHLDDLIGMGELPAGYWTRRQAE